VTETFTYYPYVRIWIINLQHKPKHDMT